VRDAFAVAGLSHVVAISGWNVAIVVAIISGLARPLRRRVGPVLPGLLAAGAVAAYVVTVGASPAVVRAALMAGALLAARLGGSPAHAAPPDGRSAARPRTAVVHGATLSACDGRTDRDGRPDRARLARWPAARAPG
jgi:competence protein ComEC